MAAEDILNTIQNESQQISAPAQNNILAAIEKAEGPQISQEQTSAWQRSAFPLVSPLVHFGTGILRGALNVPSDIAKFGALATKPISPLVQAAALPGSIGAKYPMSQALSDLAAKIPRVTFGDQGLAGTLGEIAGGGAIPYGMAEKAGVTASTMIPKAMQYLSGRAPTIAAGLEAAIPSAISAGTEAAGRGGDIPSSMVTGGIGGAAITSAVNKLVPFIFTSKISPFNILNQAKPVVQDLANSIKQNLHGSNAVAPQDISKELFNRASRAYDEFKGNTPAGQPNIYVHPDETAPALYAKAQAQGQQLGNIDNSGIKDAVNKEITKYQDELSAMDKNDPMAVKYRSYIKELNSYLPREEAPTETPYGIKPEALEKAFKEQWGNVPPDLMGEPVGRRLDTFNDFDLFKRNLNNRMRGLGDDDIVLKQSLNNIKKTTHQAIDDVLKPADKKYSEMMSLFENNRQNINTDSPFMKLYQQASPQSETFLSSYIQPGKKLDKVTNIKNLMDMLPDQDSKRLVGSWLFKDANTPKDIVGKYNELGTNQRNILFDSETRKGLDALNVLSIKHPDLFLEKGAYLDRPDMLKGQAMLGAVAALFHHPLYAAHLLAHPIGQSLMNVLPTKGLVNKLISGGLEPSATPNIMSRLLSSTVPSTWSKLRGY